MQVRVKNTFFGIHDIMLLVNKNNYLKNYSKPFNETNSRT